MQKKITSSINIGLPLVDDENANNLVHTKVVINEKECIGCTKCIQSCPVNAIIGTIHTIHTVITDLCIGCNLCVVSCPTQCIKPQSTLINTDD